MAGVSRRGGMVENSLTTVRHTCSREILAASDDTCQYWSECNSDGAGTNMEAADRTFAMGTGPFRIDSGESQQIVIGLVWAQGVDNFDSVQKMKGASALAQAAYDIDFQFSAPPAPPEVTVTAVDGGAILEWTNSPQSNNFLESYRVEDPFAPKDNNLVEFEGYEVIQYSSALDQVGVTVAVYDVINGVTRVIDGNPVFFDGLIQEEQVVVANGTDRGVQNFHVASGLTNYTTYDFGVQAYAQNYDNPGRKIFARTRYARVGHANQIDAGDCACCDRRSRDFTSC